MREEKELEKRRDETERGIACVSNVWRGRNEDF